MNKIKKYRYSEIFGKTFQGEGKFTGISTNWVRWFGCNKTCSGFGNMGANRIPEESLYYNFIDTNAVEDVRDLPVEDKGCDSYYSWHRNFTHLAKQESAEKIVDHLVDVQKNSSNPQGLYIHPITGQDTHLAFTGGESMMSQNGSADVLNEMLDRGNFPSNITIETNGTIALRQTFIDAIDRFKDCGGTLFWSVSPKILAVSGECPTKSILPEVIAEYAELSDFGQLKFVCNNRDKAWAQIANAIDEYYEVGVDWNVYIMPVGASAEMQHTHDAVIAERAIEEGYYFSGRVHCDVFANAIGK